MATSPAEKVDPEKEIIENENMEEPWNTDSEDSKSKRKKDRVKSDEDGDFASEEKVTVLEHDWDQNEKQVFIRLKLGPSVVPKDDIDFEVTDSDCKVKLKDGRHWYCKFYRDVDGASCTVGIRKDKLLEIKLLKKTICEEWSSLENNPSRKHDDDDDDDDDDDVSGMYGASGVTKIKPPSKEPQPEPEYVINMAKHNWYEKGTDTFVVHVQVKEVDETALQVIFEEERLTIKFKTRDTGFLNNHSPSSPNTLFSWTIQLRKAIEPEQCNYKVTRSCIEISMLKKVAERWGGLEASTIYTASPGRKTTPSTTPGGWMPMTRSRSNERRKIREDSDSDNDSSTSLSSSGYGSLASTSTATSSSSATDNRFKVSTHQLAKPQELAKPTCMVSPLSKNKNGKDSEIVCKKGFTGLDNLGNTCFMNSVLQVLANTMELREFFIDPNLREQINTENPLGTGGHLALSLAVLMKVLWSGKYHSYAPSKLKNIVASKASQFTGFAQHDAQEFMAFLLDGLHEDLNRVKNKPYIENKDYDGRPDEIVAEEAWTRHKKRNDSFIDDLLQGQFKSKLVCPVCSKVSITFDPFMHLSVPLPKKKRLLSVYFMSKEPYKKPKMYTVEIPQDGLVDDLKAAINDITGIPVSELRVFEAYKCKIHKIFTNGTSLSSVSTNDVLFVSEVLSEKVAGEKVLELAIIQRTIIPHNVPTRCSYCKTECPSGSKLKRCTKCYKVGYCDQNCQKNHWSTHKSICKAAPEPVGMPFILSIPESKATFSRLCTILEGFAAYSVDVFQPPVKDTFSSQSSSSEGSRPGSDCDSARGDCSSSKDEGQGDMLVLNSEDSNSRDFYPPSPLVPPTSPLVIPETPQPSPSVSDLAPSPGVEMESEGESSHPPTNEMSPNKASDDEPMAEKSPVIGSENQAAESCSSDSAPASLGSDATPQTKDDTGLGASPSPVTEEATKSENSNSSTSDSTTGNETESVTLSETGKKADQQKNIEPGNRTTMKAAVPGLPQDAKRSMPLFFLKPVTQYGQSCTGAQGERLSDKGDIPLDLSSIQYLAMDWKNHEKSTTYVLVQSKSLDYETDKSYESRSLSDQDFTLHHCLHLFTEPEKLAPEEAWYCPQCKEHREATKTMSIWRLPSTLIVQLKRFSFKNMLWRDKIDKMVDYPIRGLDLGRYCCSGPKTGHADAFYDLYGVVNHMGGILGGHYTAYSRLPSHEHFDANEVDWRLFDDSRVTPVSEKNVVSRSAYLLFYRKRKSPTPTIPKTLTDMMETSKTGDKDNKMEKDDEESRGLEDVSAAAADDDDDTNDVGGGDDNRVIQHDDNRLVDDGATPSVSGLGYTDMDDID